MKKHLALSRRFSRLLVISLLTFFLSGALPLQAGELEDHIEKASRFVKARDYPRAIQEYEAALKLDPKNPKASLLLAMTYANTNDLENALKYSEKAVEMDPSYTAYNNLALVHADKGELDKAIDNFNKALAMNPSAYKSWHYLGVIYSEKKDYDKAAENYQKALDNNYQFADAYIGLGSTLYKKGDKPGARAQVKKLKDLKLKTQGEGLEAWIDNQEKKSDT